MFPERRGSLNQNRRKYVNFFTLILVARLGHGFFHPIAACCSSRSVFGRGLELRKLVWKTSRKTRCTSIVARILQLGVDCGTAGTAEDAPHFSVAAAVGAPFTTAGTRPTDVASVPPATALLCAVPVKCGIIGVDPTDSQNRQLERVREI